MMGLGDGGSDGIKQRMMNTIANPAENEQIRAIAGAFAEIEREQRERLRDHAEAVGVDPDAAGLDPARPKEERVDEMCEALAARMTGDPWTLYVDTLAPEELENADRAKRYAGDREAFEQAKESWVAEYRSSDVQTDGWDDEVLIQRHVLDVFGLPLDEFESEVVEWSAAETFEELLAGELINNTEAISQLTEEVSES